MKNIINTKKYIQFAKVALIAGVFIVSLPVSVLAAEYTYGGNTDTYTYGGNTDTYTYGGNTDTYTYGGNTDAYTYGGNTDAYTYGGNTDVYTYGGNTDIYTYGGNQAPVYSSPRYSTPGNYTTPYTSDPYYYTPGYSYSNYQTPLVSNINYSFGTSTYGGNYSNPGYIPANYYYPTYTNTPTYYNPNQVLAYNDTPDLSSVYLSDVPATGAGDVVRIISFTLALLSWSIILAYLLLKRKQEMQNILVEVSVEPITENSYRNEFSNQILADNKAIEGLEIYAREKKVLLSSDASVKLVKLSKINNVNAIEVIGRIAGNEWIAVGEGDLAKYI